MHGWVRWPRGEPFRAVVRHGFQHSAHCSRVGISGPNDVNLFFFFSFFACFRSFHTYLLTVPLRLNAGLLTLTVPTVPPPRGSRTQLWDWVVWPSDIDIGAVGPLKVRQEPVIFRFTRVHLPSVDPPCVVGHGRRPRRSSPHNRMK